MNELETLTTYTEPKKVAKQCLYKKEYCEMLLETMKEGYSFETFAYDIGVTKQTLYNWCTMFPEFAEAKAVGIEASRKVLESNILRDAKKGNVVASIFMLKKRFPKEYGDKQDVVHAQKEEEQQQEKLTLDEQIERVELMHKHLLSLKSSVQTQVEK